MSNKAGVWVDHKQAIVILFTDSAEEIKKFRVDDPESESHEAGTGARHQHAHTKNDFVAEDKRERKLAIVRNKMYEEVLDFVKAAGSVFVIGPGEAKKELNKCFVAKHGGGLAIEVEAADKMTDPQFAAKVREHFFSVK